MVKISINSIKWVPEIYPRAKWNTETIERYADAMIAGDEPEWNRDYEYVCVTRNPLCLYKITPENETDGWVGRVANFETQRWIETQGGFVLYITLLWLKGLGLPAGAKFSAKVIKDKDKTNVYLIQSEIGGSIKIGKASDVQQRLAHLQAQMPHKLILIKEYKDVHPHFEKELHKKYAKYRLHGEWYSEEIINYEEV